jgi:hypothetical protein
MVVHHARRTTMNNMITPKQARKLAKEDLAQGREVAEQVLVNLEEEYGTNSAVANAYRAELAR